VERTARPLEPRHIVETVEILGRRIGERFPDSGLAQLCGDLLAVARSAQERARAIAQPNLPLRIAAWVLIGIVAAGLLVTLGRLDVPGRSMNVVDFVAVLESGINDVVLIGAAVFFLFTVDVRLKRRRGLRALHELRTIAHIIDMHQLTKDPEQLLSGSQATSSSPRRAMNRVELGRYLDYCSEMLALTGKVATIYVAEFDDPVVPDAVNEVENLTTGLSRKVWQKLMVLHRVGA